MELCCTNCLTSYNPDFAMESLVRSKVDIMLKHSVHYYYFIQLLFCYFNTLCFHDLYKHTVLLSNIQTTCVQCLVIFSDDVFFLYVCCLDCISTERA